MFVLLFLSLFGLSSAATVRVQSGDTLSSIAKRNGVSLQTLIAANPQVDSRRALQIGQALEVTGGTVTRSAQPSQTTTTSTSSVRVGSGDSLYLIARRNNLSMQDLLAANPQISANRALLVGQVLKVPTRAGYTVRSNTNRVTVRAASIRVSPVMPVMGRLTSRFSWSHLGIDIAAPIGTPIRAARAGRVILSRYDGRGGWGWTIKIDHGDGMVTRYSHASVNLVWTGDWVEAGQIISRVGNTGHSTGPHLDYRVIVNGRIINPFNIY